MKYFINFMGWLQMVVQKTSRKWRKFKNDHPKFRDSYYAVKISVITFVVLALIVTSITFLGAGVVKVLNEPMCQKTAKAFTGNYTNDLWAGCYIQLGDGKYYYYKNIMIIPR